MNVGRYLRGEDLHVGTSRITKPKELRMNERIKELAVQADNYAYKMNPEEDSYGRVAYPKKFQQDRDSKFAELIVKECANYINERTLDWDADLRWIFNDGSGDMAVNVDDLLNRHFGVEK